MRNEEWEEGPVWHGGMQAEKGGGGRSVEGLRPGHFEERGLCFGGGSHQLQAAGCKLLGLECVEGEKYRRVAPVGPLLADFRRASLTTPPASLAPLLFGAAGAEHGWCRARLVQAQLVTSRRELSFRL